MKSLCQKVFLYKIKIELLEKKIHYTNKKISKSIEKNYSYESLMLNYIEKRVSVNFWAVGYSLFLFSIIIFGITEELKKKSENGIFVLTLLGLILILLILNILPQLRKKIIIPVENDEPVIIYDKIPNGKTIEEFLEALKKQQKNFMLSKYARMGAKIQLEKVLERLEWLYENEFLTQEEYEEKLKEVSSYYNQFPPLN